MDFTETIRRDAYGEVRRAPSPISAICVCIYIYVYIYIYIS